MIEWLFILLALSPLILCPRYLFNGFDLPQTVVIYILSSIIFIYTIYLGVLSISTPIIIIFFFTFYIFISSIFTFPPQNARKELGTQLPLMLLFISLCSVGTMSIIQKISLSITIVAFINCIYANLQSFGIDPLFKYKIKRGGEENAMIGTIGNSNFFGSFLCIAFWFSCYSAFSYSIYILFASVFIFITIFRTGCRAGQVATIGSILAMLCLLSFYTYIPIWIAPTIIFLCGSFLFISILTMIVNWDEFWRSSINPKGKQVWYATLRYRLCYWLTAIELFKEEWLFGWGLRSYRREIYRAQGKLNKKYPDFLKPDRFITPHSREVHNDYLEHLVEYGIVGSLIFFSLIGFILYLSFRADLTFLDMILVSGFIAALINMIFFFTLRLISSASLFWIIAGALVIRLQEQYIISYDHINIFIAAFAALILGLIFYKCILNRVMSNWYYHHSGKSLAGPNDKNLIKAIKWSPYDTIYRTMASQALIDYLPGVANAHSMRMFEFYDGHTPLYITLFNMALSKLKGENGVFEEVAIYLSNAYYCMPHFKPVENLLSNKNGIIARTAYRGEVDMYKLISEKIKYQVKALMENTHRMNLEIHNLSNEEGNMDRTLALENMNLKIENNNLTIANLLMKEMWRLNIPDNWYYDYDEGKLMDPRSVNDKEKAKLINIS